MYVRVRYVVDYQYDTKSIINDYSHIKTPPTSTRV